MCADLLRCVCTLFFSFWDLSQNQAMNLKFIATSSKSCPVCGMATMKNEGCNKMSCTNCGKHWCWKCNQVGCFWGGGASQGGREVHGPMLCC